MIKLLVKKQLMEIFRSYFYNTKKNTGRSKTGTILYFLFFAVIMVGLLGGMFFGLSVALCPPLESVGMGWLFFLIMTLIAVLLGVFGSVFSTYSGLYLAKDNDLLLSMPIPPSALIVSRLIGVYLMGLMYSAVVTVPAVIVYWMNTQLTAAKIIGGLMVILLVSVFVLLLSCLLGWVVAKLSQKLKNRSFIVVILSLAFIGLYYFFYFKAQAMIQDLIENASNYGNAIRGANYPIYLVGRVGEGDWLAILIVTAVIAVLTVLTWIVLSRSFLGIATSTASVARREYREKTVAQRSAFRALLSKEFSRFTSSANYMLNCGFGVLLIPIGGIALLWKGGVLREMLGQVFAGIPGATAAVVCTSICMLASMNDMAAPSVSLEGKSIWLAQSLPVRGWEVLRAKLSMQLLLTAVPVLFCSICAVIGLRLTGAEAVTVILVPLLYSLLMACFALMLGVLRADLHWTNELAPIKQSLAIFLVLIVGWVVALIPAALFLLLGAVLPIPVLLAAIVVLFAALTALMYFWLRRSGAARFSALS